MERYRVGIVGCSGIAESPVVGAAGRPFRQRMPESHASAYALFEEIEVVAVCDLVEATTNRFLSDWNGRWQGIRAYTDYRALLDAHELDILSVATSDHRHADIVVGAAERGVRAIFCEKPLATTLEDADRMIAACENHGTILSVDHTRRWSATYHMARDRVRDGAVGELRQIVGVLGGPRAMLFRNGTHLVDLLSFFAESTPAWVWAVNDAEYGDYDTYRGDGGRTAELEPGVFGFVGYENGVRAVYNGTKHQPADFGADLLGAKGKLVVRDTGATLHRSATSSELLPSEEYVRHKWAGAVEELLSLLRDDGEPVSSGREARKAVTIMLGFLESHRRGNVRVDLPS